MPVTMIASSRIPESGNVSHPRQYCIIYDSPEYNYCGVYIEMLIVPCLDVRVSCSNKLGVNFSVMILINDRESFTL